MSGYFRNTRAKRWFGTIFNYTEDTLEILEEFLKKFKYAIYCREICPTTERPHLHFYFHSDTLIKGKDILDLLGPGDYETARGTEEDNIRYIRKDGDWIEYGTPNKTALDNLTKTERLKKMLRDVVNLPWKEFEDEYPVQAFYQGNKLRQWKFDHTPITKAWDGDLKSKNIWLWGAPRIGKSVWAHEQCPLENIYKKNSNKWWDGYDDCNTKVVLIEDFPDNKQFLIEQLKLWADRYSFNGEVKCGTIRITPGKWLLIVTSNHSIDEVFNGCSEIDIKAIKERFSEIQMVQQSVVPWTKCNMDQLIQ